MRASASADILFDHVPLIGLVLGLPAVALIDADYVFHCVMTIWTGVTYVSCIVDFLGAQSFSYPGFVFISAG